MLHYATAVATAVAMVHEDGDKNMSNTIHTIAPISLDNLKLYFADKTVNYLVDYKNSKLQGQKLLTYLGNLDLKADIQIDDARDPAFLDLLKVYFESTTLVNVPSLERAAIQVLFEYRRLLPSDFFAEFIQNNQELLSSWTDKLDSLVLYNTWIINDQAAKDEVMSFPSDETDSVDGINWVSLLKHEDFYFYYQTVDFSNLKNYTRYFNENLFKGKNLYTFWANEKNPMFLITWGILEQQINSTEWATLLNKATQEIKDQENATPV